MSALATHRVRGAAWIVSGSANAAAHAAMALAVGALAAALATPTKTSPIMPGRTLLSLACMGLAAAIVKGAAGYVLALVERLIAGDTADGIRLATVDALLASPTASSRPAILARVATRSREIEAGLRLGVLGTARAGVQLCVLAVALMAQSAGLSAVAFVALVPFGVMSALLRRRWRRRSRAAQVAAETLHQETEELVTHLQLWRTYGRGDAAREAIRTASQRATRAESRVAAGRAGLAGLNEGLGAAAVAAVIALSPPEQTPGLLAFCVVCFMAYRPLRDLGDAQGWTAQGAEAVRALDELFLPHDSTLSLCPPATWGSPEALELTAYGASARGPRTTLTIPGGSAVLLRGKTGSGKTTLLLTLLGLEPALGTLLYGKRPLPDHVGPAHRPFAWVPQEAPLITATLRENVGLGARSDAAIDDAITLAGADALAARLGGTIVGPGGQALSGGERRLVSLARALATELPILLLDEPTEGLDAIAEAQVLRALERVKGARTLIIASHRPEPAGVADVVLGIAAGAALAAE